MNKTRLSEHFLLDEFIVSATRPELAAQITVTPAELCKLGLLCHLFLEPIRLHFNRAISITSGKRSPELNQAIGGSRTSQHMNGEAVDFVVAGTDMHDVARWIDVFMPPWSYSQRILYLHDSGEARFVHIGLAPRPRVYTCACKDALRDWRSYPREIVVVGEKLWKYRGRFYRTDPALEGGG